MYGHCLLFTSFFTISRNPQQGIVITDEERNTVASFYFISSCLNFKFPPAPPLTNSSTISKKILTSQRNFSVMRRKSHIQIRMKNTRDRERTLWTLLIVGTDEMNHLHHHHHTSSFQELPEVE